MNDLTIKKILIEYALQKVELEQTKKVLDKTLDKIEKYNRESRQKDEMIDRLEKFLYQKGFDVDDYNLYEGIFTQIL